VSDSDYKVLSEDQVQQFLRKGYLTLKGCLDPDLAEKWVNEGYERLGYDRADPTTWEKDIVWMWPKNRQPIREISARAWMAICDVVGGEDRIDDRVMKVEGHFGEIDASTWSDAFIVNFNHGADQPWEPISAKTGRWHQDGAFFRHFLNSREQALLTIVYWSDVAHRGGGTFIAPDSVRHIARYLAERPEGVPPSEIPFKEIIGQCSEFVEITGEVGDFVILHPFMLHSSSQNVSDNPRWMTNPPVVLKEPMDLNREDPATFSLLERATLKALGVERLDFQPTREYEPYWEVQ
jgi:hypothetical protein